MKKKFLILIVSILPLLIFTGCNDETELNLSQYNSFYEVTYLSHTYNESTEMITFSAKIKSYMSYDSSIELVIQFYFNTGGSPQDFETGQTIYGKFDNITQNIGIGANGERILNFSLNLVKQAYNNGDIWIFGIDNYSTNCVALIKK